MGNINNLKKSFLEDSNIGQGTLAWREHLDGLGFTGHSIVDDTRNMLTDAGFWVGNMSESLYALYLSGGLPTWTLGYNGVDTFGLLNDVWIHGANWRITIVLYMHSDFDFVNFYALSAGTVVSEMNIRHNTSGTWIVYLDGSNNFPPDTGLVEITFDNTLDPISATDPMTIGAYFNLTNFFKGQIHSIELLNLDTPSNSIKIDNRIQSATQPTDFAIYNTLKPALGPELWDAQSASVGTGWTDNLDGTYTHSAGIDTVNINVGSPVNHTTIFEVVSVSAGSCQVVNGGSVSGALRTSIGTYEENLEEGNNALVYFQPSTDFVGTIRPISIKETNIIGTYSNGTYELLVDGS